jgi:two-component system response regulator PilR (NtrC family)
LDDLLCPTPWASADEPASRVEVPPDLEARFRGLVQSPLRAGLLRFLSASPGQTYDVESLMATFGRMRLDIENCLRELVDFGLVQRAGGSPVRFSASRPSHPAIATLLDTFLERRAAVSTEDQSPSVQRFREMIGRDEKMLVVFEWIRTAAKSDISVLILGPTGSGKEVVARMIHELSRRNAARFQAVNCAALPETLFESELFGYEKGAFTGAHDRKPGKFEMAEQGTLFLDEIGDLSMVGQAKLLRVLEDREIRPVGGTKPIRVEVRIVAATNRDLAQAMARGAFREDLFYRLNVIAVGLPSLRERREDIPLLVNHFLQKFTELAGAPAKMLSPEALACLEAYAWPGNIRELENVIERAVTLETGPIIRPESLPESLRRPRPPDAFQVDFPPEGIDLDKLMEQIERDLIRRALERVDGVQSRAAQLLGTGFRSFRYRLQKYGMIERGSGPDGGPDDPGQ